MTFEAEPHLGISDKEIEELEKEVGFPSIEKLLKS
jgi:hypothetical protein